MKRVSGLILFNVICGIEVFLLCMSFNSLMKKKLELKFLTLLAQELGHLKMVPQVLASLKSPQLFVTNTVYRTVVCVAFTCVRSLDFYPGF